MQAKTFKVLGLMLCYPNEEWLGLTSEFYKVLKEEALLSPEDMDALRGFMDELAATDIYKLQEQYVDTFDRIRSLSLHMFEHVHGESRDRGQAMVDLAERYKEQGFTLAASELPDYLPVFLEYLSQLSKEDALFDLSETGHILAAIGKRLAERGSPYSLVFDCLTRLSGRAPEKAQNKAESQEPDFEQIDKEWEEKPINFLGADAPAAGGCGGGGCGGGGCGGKKLEETRP